MFFRMVYKSGQIFLPFCHNSRVWRTDGRTEISSQYRVCITCSAVKTRKGGNYDCGNLGHPTRRHAGHLGFNKASTISIIPQPLRSHGQGRHLGGLRGICGPPPKDCEV